MCCYAVDLSSSVAGVSLEGAVPAVADADFAKKQKDLRAVLKNLDTQELAL